MFSNKKIFVLGMGRSGSEIAKFLIKKGNKITINDFKEDEKLEKELYSLGITVCTGSHPDDLFDNSFDYLIKNPGIRNDHQYVIKAHEFNIPVINDIELLAYFLKPTNKIIGITGSNGKTTVTTLVYQILKAAKLPVHLGGNIGIPVGKIIENVRPEDILVLEISDHQLANTDKFKTNISVLTNVSKTHLDFWDNSYGKYQQAKKKIFNYHAAADIAIINLDNADSINLTKDILSTKKYFSRYQQTDCYLENNIIYYQNEAILNINELKIVGNHNYENMMSAILVAKLFAIDNNIIKNELVNFLGIEHRLEFVGEINHRKIYNDSKSTNNEATITALKSFKVPVILIMGGLNRGQDFKDLASYMTNVKEVICYGENSPFIMADMQAINIKCQKVDTLNEAVPLAYCNSDHGDVILLSPASASWDQFTTFEERGQLFKKIVEKLAV